MSEENSDIMEKLHRMDVKLNEIQGDVNILSTLNKEKDKDLLKNLINRKFGRSKRKRRIWYNCDSLLSLEELHEETGISKSNLSPLTSEMSREGVLVKEEKGDSICCRRSEITQGIGLESDVEDFLHSDK